jgi:Protein of unknown function (DUF2510)
MNTQTEPGAVRAGWFGDPAGRHQYRYWDGVAWTAAVADNGTQSADPLPQRPPQWVPPLFTGVCEGCQAPTSAGRRIPFFAATKGGTRAEGIFRYTGHTFQARLAVLLCERCAKRTGKRASAIKHKLAQSGLGSTESFDEFEFLTKFAMQVLRGVSYARFSDIMRDDLAREATTGDATIVVAWNGQKVVDQAPLVLRIDDCIDGFGSYARSWSTRVHVPAGAHKVSVGGLRHCDQVLNAESGAVYQVDISYSRMSGRLALRTSRTG